EHKVRELANQNGVNVILSGWGGDEFVSYHGAYRCFETFWGGRPISTLRNLYAATQNQPNRFFACLKLCFEELVLRPLPGWALFWRKGRYDYDYLAASSDDFAIYARGLRRRLRRRSRLSVRGNMLLNLRQGHIENRLESWAVSGKKKGIEYRYPLLDKRLVEFALSIPPDYFFKRGVPRYIFRMAIRDVVPSYVWERNRKEEPHRVREMIDQTVKAITDWPTTRASASHIIQEHKLERLSRELVGKVQEVSLQSLVAVFLVVKSILVVNTELAQENHPPVE
ncbi:MAG: asparagine synthase C-terminal domain-containing protein, partial [Cyanobacteria bacterium P01_F01_bin.42]